MQKLTSNIIKLVFVGLFFLSTSLLNTSTLKADSEELPDFSNDSSNSDYNSSSDDPTAQEVFSKDSDDDDSETRSIKSKKSKHSILHQVVFYIPNRVFDLLDIFRFRVRVGPGVAIGARVTKPISAYAGTYASVFAGLPGPRMRPLPKLPLGLESYNGASASVVDVTTGGGIGPDYSSTEIGFSTQLVILGFDVGIDPVEIADFITNIFMLDLRDDDF